jgi:lipopolysaccharide export system permease protein
MTPFLTTIDKYILRRLARPLLGLSGVTMMILALENAPRLLRMVEGVQSPLPLMARFLVVLMPEHLAFGLMVGTFLSIALVLREMALDHELEALCATGLSPARLLRMPMLIGLLLGAVHVGLRGYAEPWGERQLDHIGLAARSGDLGIAIRAGEFQHFGANFTLLAEAVDSRTGRLDDLFVQMRGANLTAQSAHIRNGGSQGVVIDFENGSVIRQNDEGGWQTTRFRAMRLPIRAATVSRDTQPAMDLADRKTSSELFELVRSADKAAKIGPATALSALVLRIGQALLIPLLPWLALALAIPPVRSTSAIGIGAGMALIVAFIEGANMVAATTNPIVGMSALLAFIATLTGCILLRRRRHGLDVATRGLLALLPRPRGIRTRHATVHRLMPRSLQHSIRQAA